MMVIPGQLGMAVMTDAAYVYTEQMNFIWGSVQVAVLMSMVFVSIFKPWDNIWKKSER